MQTYNLYPQVMHYKVYQTYTNTYQIVNRLTLQLRMVALYEPYLHDLKFPILCLQSERMKRRIEVVNSECSL